MVEMVEVEVRWVLWSRVEERYALGRRPRLH